MPRRLATWVTVRDSVTLGALAGQVTVRDGDVGCTWQREQRIVSGVSRGPNATLTSVESTR